MIGEVVKVKNEKSDIISLRFASKDIVIASMRAIVDVANKMTIL